MNKQYFEERADPSEFVEETDKENLVENSDTYDEVTEEPGSVIVTPMVEEDTYESETYDGEDPDTSAGSTGTLFRSEDADQFRTRWYEIQSTFVDEPREAVQQADALVTDVTEYISQIIASEHDSLERQWNQDENISTEDLRKALQRYRAFFNRLVV